jgi:hypothetical protein
MPISEDEVKKVVMSAPKEKALGPDGFIGSFFFSLLGHNKRGPPPGHLPVS